MLTNIDEYKSIPLLFSKYILTITNKHKDRPSSFSQYILTNINDKADNFIREEVWLRPSNYLLFVT